MIAAFAICLLLGLSQAFGSGFAAYAQDNGQPAAEAQTDQQAAPDAAPEPAAQPQTIEADTPIPGWTDRLNEIELRLREEEIARPDIEAARAELEELRTQIQTFVAEQQPLLPQLESRLQSLGPAPDVEGAPELKDVADQRAELQTSIAGLKGSIQASDEALVRIDGLTREISALRRSLFEKQLLERNPSPFSPELWRYIGQDTTIALNRLNLMKSHLWDTMFSEPSFIVILLTAIAIAAALTFIIRRQIDHIRVWTSDEPPSDWRRMEKAGRVILMRLLPPAAGCFFFYGGLYLAGLLTPTSDRVALVAINSIIIVAAVQAVVKTALAIRHPQWHLIDIERKAARSLYYQLLVLAAIYGVDVFVSEIVQLTAMPISISIAQSVISSALIAGLVISILLIRPAETADTGKARAKLGPAYIRFPLWAAALIVIAATFAGYFAFARFVTGQLIVTSTILILTYLLVFWASAFGQTLTEEQSPFGIWLQNRFRMDARRAEQLALPITLVIKALIILGAIPFILLLWGFDWFDIGSWLRQAFLGFNVGGVQISIISIVGALLLFLVIFVLARLFQAWLDRSVLERAGVDNGLRDSVRTGIGYLGVAIATLISVSYLGLDFSNLAIVAGALSVGIGFGLQSIVNNFVSGLILLAERPIKAGDWIIAGGHEGIVRKISVRSTEIETFDRANVVIPNSVLISESVKNWTLHNNTGRMSVPVGVHYDSDPELVRDILLEVARDNPQVMSNPAPFVYFDDFADNSLNFVLYVYLSNVNFSFSARTNLRIEILKAFRKEGVEIPYPQRDIHIGEAEWLKKALNGGKTPSSRRTPARDKEKRTPATPPSTWNDPRNERGEIG